MIRLIPLALSIQVFLLACSRENTDHSLNADAKGGKSYGGVFKMSLSDRPARLFPYAAVTYNEQLLCSQLYETLFILDSAQQPIGNLAEKHEVLDGGKTLRIYLKKNISFHGGGAELSAKDVLFSLAFLCSSSTDNNYAYLLIDKLRGGKTFFEKPVNGEIDFSDFKGAKIIGEHLIDVYLTFPYAQLPQLLSHPNLVMLSYEHYKSNPLGFLKAPIGTGPFTLESITREKTRFIRNQTYWKTDDFGNRLPFLEAVEAYYSLNQGPLFQEGKLDIIQNISAENIKTLFGNLNETGATRTRPHRLFQQKDKNLNFILYNKNSPPFDLEENRKLIHNAIDRKILCETVLDGDGEPCKETFTPYSFFKPLSFPVQARQNLKKTSRRALIKRGDKINFFLHNNSSELSQRLVNELIEQIEKNTGLIVRLVVGSDADFDRMWKKGEIHLVKYGWVADYPGPDSYLGIFYSESSFAKLNCFNSIDFDSLYLQTFRKSHTKAMLEAQYLCDRHLINNAYVSPLFLQDFIFLININWRDFHINSSGQIDFSTVFYKPVQKLN